MSEFNHRVSVVFKCRRGEEHPLCVSVSRGVLPELRCTPDQGRGYGPGSGGGYTVPSDLTARVERELRDSFQESKRRGFELIEE